MLVSSMSGDESVQNGIVERACRLVVGCMCMIVNVELRGRRYVPRLG
jgi:hypothetical protein